MGTVANTEVVNSLGGAVVEVLPVGGVVVVGVVGVVVVPVGGGGVGGVPVVPVPEGIVLVGVVVVLPGVVVVPPGVVVPGLVVLAITWVKVAVHDLFPVMTTCPLTQSSLQLPNCQPVAGVAERVTAASCEWFWLQLLPHPPIVPCPLVLKAKLYSPAHCNG